MPETSEDSVSTWVLADALDCDRCLYLADGQDGVRAGALGDT